MPCQHNLKVWLREYIEAAGIGEDGNGPLFRTVDRKTKTLLCYLYCTVDQ